ncbi:hypothetical protein HGRIS_011298 [Hohenbuehelia grisea]|uniref:J domain-containing protein n=1 Tax=Hohenbuehelia grisea TaxID=104357 RepID=A0ABR3JVG5_9AGAR
MSSAEDEVNPYELLEIQTEATEQEIRTSYRKKSLKVHPDRNPNNPDAARKFHELNQAYELLLDPLRRLALDAKLRVKQARKERFKAYDNKRKNLVEELEERERQFKKARREKQDEEIKVWHETERIKDEGRRLREEKMKGMAKQHEETTAPVEPSDADLEAPSLGDFDTTVRLKYLIATHANLTTPSGLAALLAPFGDVDASSIVLSMKPPKKAPTKPPKYATALVPFKRVGDAFAAVCASQRPEHGLDGVEVGWVEGKEPPLLSWLKKMGKLGAAPPPIPKAGSSTSVNDGPKARLPQHQESQGVSGFSSFPDKVPDMPLPSIPSAGVDFESLTLMRMRQAEKERLEREILAQEAGE